MGTGALAAKQPWVGRCLLHLELKRRLVLHLHTPLNAPLDRNLSTPGPSRCARSRRRVLVGVLGMHRRSLQRKLAKHPMPK